MAKDANGNKIPKTEKAAKSGGFDDGFGDPSSGGGNFVAADLVGSLLLISPIEMSDEIVTTNGPATPLLADIVRLTNGKGKAIDAELIEGALVFQKVLISTLKPSIGKNRVLGVLIQDENRKKPGQSAPFVLNAATDDHKDIARAYLKSIDPFAA